MSDSHYLVSVIIPTFNRAGLIKETLDSVQNQTYQNWECIIVDDYSTDNTLEIISAYATGDDRFIIVNNQKTKGAPGARNTGLNACKGFYVILLDSDDLLAPFCLERRVDLFCRFPEQSFLVFPMLLFKNEINDLNILWNIDSYEEDITRFLRIDALWQTSGPIYKKEALLQIEGFREHLAFWQDYDLHLRFLLLGYKYQKFLNVEPDSYNRQHYDNSISRSISFTENEAVLQQRINFFFYQIEFIKNNKIVLTKQHRYTLWCVLSYFTSCYLHEHNNKKLYKSNWIKTRELLNYNRSCHRITYVYNLLAKVCNRSVHFLWLKVRFYKILKNYIADPEILLKTTMMKIAYREPEFSATFDLKSNP